MFNGSNCDQKSQLSGILTEPLNPRGQHLEIPFIQYNGLNKYIKISLKILIV